MSEYDIMSEQQSGAWSDPLSAAKKRTDDLPPGFITLWNEVAAIIKRDGNPADPNASVPGATNQIIELCRQHFSKQ